MSKMMAGRFHDVLLGVFELYDAVGWPPLALYRMFQSNDYDRSETSTGGLFRQDIYCKVCGFLIKSPHFKGESLRGTKSVHRCTSSRMLHCVDWYRVASVPKALSAVIVTTR